MIAAFPHAMPVEGLLGGLLIGLSAAIMLLGNGRIAGVSEPGEIQGFQEVGDVCCHLLPVV